MSSKITLFVFSAALLICPVLLTQETPPKADPSKDNPCDTHKAGEGPCLKLNPDDLEPWVPERKARFARAFQYQFGLQEQTGTASVQNGSTVQFIPTPEHYLIKHSLTFQLSELFLTPSDFGSALKTYSDTHPHHGFDLHNICGGDRALNCVASSGAWWHRAFSGVKIIFSLSERTRVVSGIVVPEGPFPANYDKAGEVDFDPTAIFNIGSNWKNAATALAGLPLGNGEQGKDNDCFLSKPVEGYKLDADTAEGCVNRYAGFKAGSGNKERFRGFLAVALPTFKFARQTQFDFLKNGSVLIPAIFPESALNSYTFAWDLKRLIAPAKERVAVADAITTYNKRKSDGDGTKLCVTIVKDQKSYMPISDRFPEASCQHFADKMSGGNFEFACVDQDGEVSFGKDRQKPTGRSCTWKQ